MRQINVDENVSPPKRSSHKMVTNNKDKIYLFGGTYFDYARGQCFLNDIWELYYDDDILKWKEIKPLNSILGRSEHGLIFNDNKLYVFGGFGHRNMFSDFKCLDLSNNTLCWDNIEIQNMPLMHSFSYDLYEKKIFIFGGVIDSDRSSNLYCINIDKKEINKINIIRNNLNVFLPRTDHSSCIIRDKLYIFGGKYIRDSKLYYIDLKNNYQLGFIETSMQYRYHFSMVSYSDKLSSYVQYLINILMHN